MTFQLFLANRFISSMLRFNIFYNKAYKRYVKTTINILHVSFFAALFFLVFMWAFMGHTIGISMLILRIEGVLMMFSKTWNLLDFFNGRNGIFCSIMMGYE